MALDWGKARIGVAACDPDGTLAYPVETVPTATASRRLPQLLAEYEPIEVLIGLPRTWPAPRARRRCTSGPRWPRWWPRIRSSAGGSPTNG